MRSEATSGDYATSGDVLTEVLSEYRVRGCDFDVLACIYPTTPFMTAEELRNAARFLRCV